MNSASGKASRIRQSRRHAIPADPRIVRYNQYLRSLGLADPCLVVKANNKADDALHEVMTLKPVDVQLREEEDLDDDMALDYDDAEERFRRLANKLNKIVDVMESMAENKVGAPLVDGPIEDLIR